jgi:hypothetical protein
MAEPYNYNVVSPNAAFQNAFAFGDAIAARDAEKQAAFKKQAEQLAEKQKVQAALESIAKDRTPENLARNLLLVPSIKEQVLASESILSEAEKTANNQFRAEVIGLAKGGNIDAAKARLKLQAEGYANTPGKEKEAAAAQALLKTFDINPESVIVPMTIQLAESNKDLYEALFKGSELTAFQKNLVAANIDPKSPRGIALAENFAVNQADPLVEIDTPNNTKFVGPRSEYFRRYGDNAPQPRTIPSPKSAAERDALPAGTQYYAPDGSLKTKGGQTSTTRSGNFQGQ